MSLRTSKAILSQKVVMLRAVLSYRSWTRTAYDRKNLDSPPSPLKSRVGLKFDSHLWHYSAGLRYNSMMSFHYLEIPDSHQTERNFAKTWRLVLFELVDLTTATL